MKEVAEFCTLTPEEQAILKEADSLDMDKADHMIENVIGRFTLPMGVGINFVINGKDYVIPMVTEEPSVVAACSNAAKMARPGGGFTTDYPRSNCWTCLPPSTPRGRSWRTRRRSPRSATPGTPCW